MMELLKNGMLSIANMQLMVNFDIVKHYFCN
jgi:hypothetical protein